MNPPPLPVLQPTADRDEALDAVRGFAILGLIFSNMPGFASAEPYRAWMGVAVPRSGWPAVGEFLVEFLLVGKCVTILCFLLGVGLALQQRRAEAAGRSFAELTARRMGALFVIGIFHIVFLWWGDILCAYAILGFGLLLLHRLPPMLLRGLAAAGFGATLLVAVGLGFLPGSGEPFDKETAAEMEKYVKMAEEAYRSGPLSQLFLTRMIEAFFMQFMMLLLIPLYLGVALLGYDAIRSGWFPWKGAPAHPGVIGGLAAAGLGLCGLAAWSAVMDPALERTYFIFVLAGTPGAFLLAAAYLWGLLRWPEGKVRRTLAAVGRTALSNYLLQSFCAAVIFHSWGFGLYGKLPFSQTLLVAAALVLLQITWPAWWLRHFRFGPMEYLWRLLSYGRAAGSLWKAASETA
jgi:uncharacterized protein